MAKYKQEKIEQDWDCTHNSGQIGSDITREVFGNTIVDFYGMECCAQEYFKERRGK